MTPESFLNHVIGWFPAIVIAAMFLAMTIRIIRNLFYDIRDDD